MNKMEKTIYKKITITLPEKLAKEFKQVSEDNGFNMSGRIAILIKNDLEVLKKQKSE